MNVHNKRLRLMLALCLLGLAGAAAAAQGLAAPAAENLWPQWQARITLMTSAGSSLALAPLADSGAAPQGLRGGALLGDFIFAAPAYGRFRASGGLMNGHLGGLPLFSAGANSRLGVSVQRSALASWAPGAESRTTLPYLGLGFSGGAGLDGLAFSADVGMVAERPEAAANLGRALFGNQGLERSLRELRLSPVMQLALRYTF